METFPVLRSLVRGLALSSSLLLVSCDKENCETLRDELYTQKLSWQACRVDSDCEIIGGNTSDCTGILSCNLAVNSHFVLEAERRIASLPEETVECHRCGSPNCPEGEIAYCDPAYRRCVIVKAFIDGGKPAAGFAPGGAPGTGGFSGEGGDLGAGGSSGSPGDGSLQTPSPQQ